MKEQLTDLFNYIINFIKEDRAVAFSGYAVYIFGLIVASLLFVIRKIYTGLIVKPKSVMELVQSVNQDEIYNKCDLAEALQIRKIMRAEYKEYKDFLLIQYGSSVRSDNVIPNDFDFIVLLLGHPQEDVKKVHSVGSYPFSEKNDHTQVDVVFRDYLSFMFAASAGMPYENSVIVNSKLLHGHRGYYLWLKNITRNLLMDRDFLLRRFDDKISIEKETYIKTKKNSAVKNNYDIIRAGYYYITSVLQRERIKNMSKVISQKDIVELAYVRNLVDDISDEDIRNKYKQLIEGLKRNELQNMITSEDIEGILMNCVKEI